MTYRPGRGRHPADTTRIGQLAMLKLALQTIARADPSNPDNADRPSALTERDAYRIRNAHIYKAISIAMLLGYNAGVQPSAADPGAVIAFIELPDAGQVAWTLPTYLGRNWHVHGAAAIYEQGTYERVAAFAGISRRAA